MNLATKIGLFILAIAIITILVVMINQVPNDK